jgi:hypothetical protein
MIEKTIKGIKYLLDEENLTAVVIYKRGYEGDIIIPETVVFQKVAYHVTSIGGWAFEKCSSLTSIVIGNGVTSIGDRAFVDCKSLSSIVIPDSVTSIGEGAFFECESLSSIVIPDSVTTIGKYAFTYCSSLSSISYNGTMEQWKEIEFYVDWNEEVPATVVHCTDGDVEI